MKACNVCKEVQPIENFSRNRALKSGRRGACKKCCLEYQRLRRKRPEVRERDIAWHREYRKNNPEEVKARHKKFYEEHREERIARMDKIHKERPAQRAAQRKCQGHVRTGKLERQPCEKCGEPGSHAHHDNYDEPLNVRWLCAKHHARLHRWGKFDAR